MFFTYIAYKASGEMVKGEIEAESEARAEESLWKSNLTITSLHKKKARPSIHELLPSLYGVNRDEIVNFTRDLHTLLTAGIGIYPSLTMLHERAAKASLKTLVHNILESVEGGNSFSEAIAKYPQHFSPFYLRMTRVGEEIGNLEQMLEQITIQMAKETEIKRKVKGAMIYPIIVMIVAVGAIAALMIFVVPAMSSLFDQMGGELPMLTKIVVAVSNFVTGNILYIIISLVVLIGGNRWFLKTPRGKRFKDGMMLKIPIFRDVTLKGGMARNARNMALLLGGGVSITDALDLVIETSDNVHFKEAFIQVRTEVNEGLLLSQAMKNQALFPTLLIQVVGVGEMTGKLEPNLVSAADFYETETDRAVNRVTSLLTPIMTVIIGAIVALIALSVYMPMYGISSQLNK